MDVSSEIEFVGNGTTGNSNSFYVTRTAEKSVRMLFYKEGLVYIFTVTRRSGLLDFVINLDSSLNGETRGLLGNFNGDGTDDFIKPNGITVPSDANDQTLHEYGQSCE